MRAHLLAACGLLAVLSSGAARAETTELGKLDKDKLRQQCTDERGDWAENGDWFVCSKDCEGGECIVICFGEDGCLGSTPESWESKAGT